MDAFDELVERVKGITGLNSRAASAVAMSLSDTKGDEAVFSATDIAAEAEKLGYEVERKGKDPRPPNAPLPELSLDPAVVLAQVYEHCPRVLTPEVPRIGRAPKESVFYDEDLQAAIDALPEEIRLLIAGVDLVNGQVNVRLYDEANDLDREIGPIDLTRYSSGRELEQALRVLIGRLPRVLSSDFN